jgi:putative FmdB family regulatory protein
MLALSVCECQPAEEHVPTYQYRCTACDHRFEAVQSFSDASLTTCPACTGTLRKVFSSVGIVFKGSGFYRTDSRSGSGNTVSSGDATSKNGTAKDGGSSNGSGPAKVGADSGSSSSSSSTSTSAPAAAAS